MENSEWKFNKIQVQIISLGLSSPESDLQPICVKTKKQICETCHVDPFLWDMLW